MAAITFNKPGKIEMARKRALWASMTLYLAVPGGLSVGGRWLSQTARARISMNFGFLEGRPGVTSSLDSRGCRKRQGRPVKCCPGACGLSVKLSWQVPEEAVGFL